MKAVEWGRLPRLRNADQVLDPRVRRLDYSTSDGAMRRGDLADRSGIGDAGGRTDGRRDVSEGTPSGPIGRGLLTVIGRPRRFGRRQLGIQPVTHISMIPIGVALIGLVAIAASIALIPARAAAVVTSNVEGASKT